MIYDCLLLKRVRAKARPQKGISTYSDSESRTGLHRNMEL